MVWPGWMLFLFVGRIVVVLCWNWTRAQCLWSMEICHKGPGPWSHVRVFSSHVRYKQMARDCGMPMPCLLSNKGLWNWDLYLDDVKYHPNGWLMAWFIIGFATYICPLMCPVTNPCTVLALHMCPALGWVHIPMSIAYVSHCYYACQSPIGCFQSMGFRKKNDQTALTWCRVPVSGNPLSLR